MRLCSTILFLYLGAALTVSAQNKYTSFHSDFERAAFDKIDLIPLELLLASDPEMDNERFLELESAFDEIIEKALTIKGKAHSESRFLEKLFYTIHRKNLSWYENYVTFGELIEEKKYDCLTGTALLALIMEEMDVSYQILEFDFHIFLLAQADGEMVLMEATDPIDGFVTNPLAIHDRIKEAYESSSVEENYQKTQIMNKIDLVALAGLQYYNLAVDQFNSGNYGRAKAFIKKADILYPSERIKNTASLIATSSL